ncbi:MAG: caspase family protein [Bacteroidota bacterium]|nr:caspase family protein [Bacteroidota bacterium]
MKLKIEFRIFALLSFSVLATFAQTTKVKSNTIKADIKADVRGEGKLTTSTRFDDEKALLVAEEMYNRRNYALFIAVEEYKDDKINDLDKPVRDAENLRKILLQNYNFNEKDVLFLKNPTRDQIVSTFDKLAKMLTAKDNLLIFYAGHGVWDATLKKGYWLPADAQREVRSQWFSNGDLRDYISGIPSKHTLLIADACFSGGIFKTRDAFASKADASIFEMYKLPSRQAMTSGAMKTVPDESVFIKFLAKRLAENDKPFVGGEELFASFKTAVINNSQNGQVPQFGEIKETGDEGGDFIFVKKKTIKK